MFGNGRKTIGVFIRKMTEEYQSGLCRTLGPLARSRGYNLAVYSTFGSYGDDKEYSAGEMNLLDIPCYEKLDGIILCLDVFNIPEMDEKIRQRVIERSNCPIISIREAENFCPSVTADNEAAMKQMLEHIIVEHGVKRICYMSGRKGFWASEVREHCYRESMKEHNLEIRKHYVYNGDMWRFRGKEAVDQFYSVPGEEPEAIICANDYMAIAVLQELKKRGIRVPQDVMLTGFDNIDETLEASPSITTIDTQTEEFATIAFEKLDAMIRGEIEYRNNNETYRVPSQLIKRESCGCSNDRRIETLEDKLTQMSIAEHQYMQEIFMFYESQKARNLDALNHVIGKYIDNNRGVENYYVLLNQEEDFERASHGKNPFTPQMTAVEKLLSRTSMRNHVHQIEVPFDWEEQIPNLVGNNDPQVLFFSPLHFRNHCFGYEAISFVEDDPYGGRGFYQGFTIQVCSVIESIYVNEEMKRLNHEKEMLYVSDTLTGLYNRMGFEERARMLFLTAKKQKRSIVFFNIDMDGLKLINDTYGHAEGDVALKLLANAMKKATINGQEISARVGGDEYNVVAPDYDDEMAESYRNRVEHELERIQKRTPRPYTISASIGYYIHEVDDGMPFEKCMREADARMYKIKMKKKNCRK